MSSFIPAFLPKDNFSETIELASALVLVWDTIPGWQKVQTVCIVSGCVSLARYGGKGATQKEAELCEA